MTSSPTLISLTTRVGSRRHVPRLNQPRYCGKGEPNRRKAGLEPRPPRIGEPGPKAPSSRAAVTDASLLLVILHYLLKNNIRIYEYDMCRLSCPPSASADKTKSTVGGN